MSWCRTTLTCCGRWAPQPPKEHAAWAGLAPELPLLSPERGRDQAGDSGKTGPG